MKVLLTWLREFAPIEGDPTELGEAMSSLGMAVESMETFDFMDGLVVARVLDLRSHPSADRIQLVDVDAGDGEPLQICCGAFNMAVGDLVPLATLGSTMPNGMEIARRRMRGEWSNGMLCSAAEIGLGSDAAGIMVLPEGLTPGTPVAEALGLADEVLWDLEINPNRPDAMSVIGVARDLAAHLGVPFSVPRWVVPETGESVSEVASVEISAPELCGRFVARVLRDVTVGSSPTWMQTRLSLCGMRPINSVVDVSNYVMLELGIPNHTYDLNRVPGGHLGVRWAREGERIVTLDGVERDLGPTDGVIVDADDTPIGIAGVMGGASTEIGPGTTDVLLEAAWWNQRAIAETSARLGLRSEASARFERGADWAINDLATDRFCHLMSEMGATVTRGHIDVFGVIPERPRVTVRVNRVNAMLGTTLDGERIRGLLEPIGFEFEPGSPADAPVVVVPSFRPDTTTEIDVIEEIARHHGYDRIETTVPRSPVAGHLTGYQQDRRRARRLLVGAGLTEAMPLPFLAPGDVTRAGLRVESPVTLANPLAAEESVLRPSLLPGILNAIAYNESHRNPSVEFFEIGTVFSAPAPGEIVPTENEHLAVALAGREAPGAKEYWDLLVAAFDAPGATLRNQDDLPGLHPTRGGVVSVGDSTVGVVGEVDPGVLEAWGIPERVAWLEIDLGAFLRSEHGAHRYRPVSVYPSSDIDLAFVVPDDRQASEVEEVLRDAAGPELARLVLFDVYRGEGVEPGSRSLAYSLRLQAPDRTLTDEDVALIRARCIEAVEDRLGGHLRH